MNRQLAAIFFWFIPVLGMAQDFPSGYFSNPLDSELILKGSFGEVRTDHLHSGLDLGTGEKTGLPVKAAAGGYVSRIKISATGYGKALYLTHPNGFVTVYAHLQSFSPEIDEVARKEQYGKELFEIDFLLPEKELKIKKGEIIALSGNTGGSTGPHLHFEIRDEKSEEPINPLLFGIPVQDTVPPVIRSLRIFPVPMKGTVDLSDRPLSYPVEYKDGMYSTVVPDYIRAFGLVAFGIEATDKANGSDALLGPYSVTLTMDTDTVSTLVMDRFNFSDTRAANGIVDYALKMEEGATVFRCHTLSGLPALKPVKYPPTGGGWKYLADEQAHPLYFRVSDFAGNVATLQVDILASQAYGKVQYSYPVPGQLLLSPFQGAAVHKSRSEVMVPKNAVYDTCFIEVQVERSLDQRFVSDILIAGDPSIPLHSAITVGLKPDTLPDSLHSKAVMVRVGNRLVSLGGKWKNGFLSAASRQFGRFGLALDTLSPGIMAGFDTMATLPDTLVFYLGDDLSGIQSYRAELNGQWMLMEYDAKSNTLSGILRKEDLSLENSFTLTVGDYRKNESVFRFGFLGGN